MKKLRLLLLLAAAVFASNAIHAQTYVKAPDGTVVFTISSSNKFYLGKGYDQYEAQLKGDVLDISGSYQETVFRNGILYFNDVPTLKTVGGKTYGINEDGQMDPTPTFVRKGNNVYDEEGNLAFTFSKAVSDKVQSTIVFFLVLIANAAQ